MAYYKRERTTTTLSIDMGNSSDDESSTIEISNYRSYQSVYTESVPQYVIPKPSYPINKRQLTEVATTPIPENVKPARSSRSSISFLLNPVSRKDEPEEEEEEQEDEHDSSPLPQSPVFHSSPKSAFKPIINQTAPLQPPRAMQISNILSPPTADNNDLPSPFTPSPSISPSPVASTSMPSSSTSNNLLSNLSTLRKTIGLINHAPLRAPTTAISLPTPTRVELVAPASVDTPSTSPRKASSRTPSSSPVSGNDDTPAATKKRKRAAPDQLQVLEETFKRDPLPNSATKQRLAQELGMSPRRVTIWFQNKRARLKKGGGKEKPSKKELLTFHHLGMQDGNLTLHSDGCEPVVMPPTLQRVPKRKLPSHRRGRLTQHQTTPTLNYPAIDDQQHL